MDILTGIWTAYAETAIGIYNRLASYGIMPDIWAFVIAITLPILFCAFPLIVACYTLTQFETRSFKR